MRGNVYHCPAREILKFSFAAVLFWPAALLHQWFRVKVPLQRGLEPDELDLGCYQLLRETGEPLRTTSSEVPFYHKMRSLTIRVPEISPK